MFSANSVGLARRVLRLHGIQDVELIKADICAYPSSTLPRISVCLLDVDLSKPTYEGLRRVWPKVEDGGVVLVDDCSPESSWKARHGYAKFMNEIGRPEEYNFGFGTLRK
jgi:hypothetical protein